MTARDICAITLHYIIANGIQATACDRMRPHADDEIILVAITLQKYIVSLFLSTPSRCHCIVFKH